MIFLIEKIWSDSMENDSSAALGYEAAGYVETEEEAKAIVEEGGEVPVDYNWVTSTHARIFNGMRYSMYKYKKIEKININNL